MSSPPPSSSAPPPPSPPPPQRAFVCGAGAVGASVAYFLSQKGLPVTIVEKSAVACAASGKAGGFLALDWSDGSPSGQLARASFRLHQQLALELGGASYGYRPVDTLSVSIEEPVSASGPSKKRTNSLPTWIDGPVKRYTSIGSKETTAQVHPQLFTQALIASATEKYGAKLLIGEAQEVKVEEHEGNARVTGLVVDGNCLPAETVVLAMGPWSSRNKLVSSLTPISGLKAHSIVLRPREPDSVSAHALFLAYKTTEGRVMEPEVYPRPTGEVYVCGMSEEGEVPDDPGEIKPRGESIAMLQRVAGTVSTHLMEAELKAEQACFLPCSEDGIPVIGKIPGVEGAYVATGHSCWGILNAPATGASLAELIVDGRSKLVDLRFFDPARFVKTGRRKTLQV